MQVVDALKEIFSTFFGWLVTLLLSVFGSKNERELNKMAPLVEEINALEEGLHALSDEELRGQTEKFKERWQAGETLDELLAEAFAVVREASVRILGMRHFDVQLIGGMVLHHGNIAEMKTGEGKTLAATLPVYLNALTGKGVHVITVNDYLAIRDSAWTRRSGMIQFSHCTNRFKSLAFFRINFPSGS